MKAEWTNSDSLTTSQTTKAILVIDIPNGYETDEVLIDYALHTKGEYKLLRKGGNHDVRPMPEKMTLNGAMNVGYGTDGFAYRNGWNDCLDEILGDTE